MLTDAQLAARGFKPLFSGAVLSTASALLNGNTVVYVTETFQTPV